MVKHNGTIFRCGLYPANFPFRALVRGDNCFGGHWHVFGSMLRLSHDNLSTIAHGEPSVRGHPELALDWAAHQHGYVLTALGHFEESAATGHRLAAPPRRL